MTDRGSYSSDARKAFAQYLDYIIGERLVDSDGRSIVRGVDTRHALASLGIDLAKYRTVEEVQAALQRIHRGAAYRGYTTRGEQHPLPERDRRRRRARRRST